MDIERFRTIASNAATTKRELMAMRDNALRMGALEHVRVAEDALEALALVRSRRGGKTPTTVTFLGKQRDFLTAKEAYLWLIERFVERYPRPLTEIGWETHFIAIGPRSVFFARSLAKLFASAPHLADDPNKYHRLGNGWFVKLVLSNKQKLEILLKFASLASLQFGKDWDWNARGQTYEHIDGDALLEQFETR